MYRELQTRKRGRSNEENCDERMAVFVDMEICGKERRRITSVIELCDGPESLLSCCVPYLQPNNCGSVDVNHAFGQKRSADGRLRCGRRECVPDVTVDERGLSHTLTAEHHDFGLEAVRHGCVRALEATLRAPVVMQTAGDQASASNGRRSGMGCSLEHGALGRCITGSSGGRPRNKLHGAW